MQEKQDKIKKYGGGGHLNKIYKICCLKTNNNKILYNFIVYAVIIYAVAIRIFAFNTNIYNIYGDECHNIYQSILPWNLVFTKFIEGSDFLPLYKSLIKILYMIFGVNWFAVKFPMLICSILSVFLFNKVLNKIFQSALVKIASLIFFASSLSLIYYSCSTKPYIYDVLVTLLLLNFVYSLENISEISWKKLWLYILGACFFVYSCLPSIVIIYLYWGIFFIKNIFVKHFENIKKLILFWSIIFITTVIEGYTYLLKMATYSHLRDQWLEECYFFAPNSFDAINAIFRELFYEEHFFDNEIVYHYSDNIIILILLIFFTGTVSYVWKIFKSDLDIQERIKGFFVITPVYFFIALGFLSIYPFCNRTILFLYPIFILILLKPFDFKKNILIDSVRNIFFIAIIIFYSFDIYKPYSELLNFIFTKNPHSISIIEDINFLQKATEDNKLIFIGCPNEDMPFCFILTNKKDLSKFRAYYIEYIINNNVFCNEIFTKTRYENLDFNNLLKDKEKIILFFDGDNSQKEQDVIKMVEENFEIKSSYKFFSYYEIKKRREDNERN